MEDGKAEMDKMMKDNMIKCLTDKLFKDLGNCVKGAKCETFDADFEKSGETLGV